MRRIIREQEPVRPSTRLTQELVAADVSPRQSTKDLAITTQEEVSADSRRRLRLKEQIHLVRGDLDWIVMKCLEKDRTRRYETANGLAQDVETAAKAWWALVGAKRVDCSGPTRRCWVHGRDSLRTSREDTDLLSTQRALGGARAGALQTLQTTGTTPCS